jgi:hypothetical protein
LVRSHVVATEQWSFAERWLYRKYPGTPRDLVPLLARLAAIGGSEQ